jgi:hypothetical protein
VGAIAGVDAEARRGQAKRSGGEVHGEARRSEGVDIDGATRKWVSEPGVHRENE